MCRKKKRYIAPEQTSLFYFTPNSCTPYLKNVIFPPNQVNLRSRYTMSSIHCIDVELINSDQREYEFISKQIGKLQVRLLHSKIKVEAYFPKVNTQL